MKTLWILCSFVLAFFLIVPNAEAIQLQNGEMVSIKPTEIINESLFITGNSVTIEGKILGDVFCAGQNIVISGVVEGDVLCAGQNIRVSGVVNGNIRSVGQVVQIEGNVARNIMIAGQSMIISPNAMVDGEVVFAGQSFSLGGTVGKSIAGVSQDTTIDGSVAGNVNVETERFKLGDNATVSGTIKRTEPKKESAQKVKKPILLQPYQRYPINVIPGIVVNGIIGLIAAYAFPLFIRRAQKHMKDDAVMTGLKGAALVVFTPIIILSLLLTIIGIPVALLGIMLYVCVLCASRLLVGMVVGRELISNFNKKNSDNLYYQVLIGVPVLWLMMKAPVVGGLIAFIAILWGTGGMVQAFQKKTNGR